MSKRAVFFYIGFGILLVISFATLNLFPMPAAAATITNCLLAVFWIFAANKLRDFFLPPAALKKIAFMLRLTRTPGDLVRNLSLILKEDMGVEYVRFFFKEKSSGNYVSLENLCESEQKVVSENNDLIKNLLARKSIISLNKDSGWSGVLCVPSFLDDQLIAFFILGGKSSGGVYTKQDHEVFKNIAGLIATALRFVVDPFFEVKEQFEASEQKLTEAEKQLETSHRLASLGTVASGIMHEVRNPLAVIRSNIDIIKSQPRDLEYLEEFHKKCTRHIDRIDQIIEKTLQTARQKKGARIRIPVDLNKLIENAVNLINLKDTRLLKELTPLPAIKGDPEEIERVIINIAQNAVQSMFTLPEGPEGKEKILKIKTYCDSQKVFVEISDTGIGIPKKDLPKIFDPFFTSKHEGTGLGLSIVYRIIKEHGGNIFAESEEGRGTVFKIEFDAE